MTRRMFYLVSKSLGDETLYAATLMDYPNNMQIAIGLIEQVRSKYTEPSAQYPIIII